MSKKKKNIIRSTSHSTQFLNTGKLIELKELIVDCKSTMQQYLDYLWSNKITWTITDNKTGQTIQYEMDIQNNNLDHPNMLSNPELEIKISNFTTNLSGRLCKCLLTQVLGMIGASVEKQRKRLYMLEKLKSEGKEPSKQFLKKLEDNIPKKPKLDNIKLELNSICCDYQIDESKQFNGYLQLDCLYKDRKKNKDHIRIPIKFHRNNKKYLTWKMLPSFLISDQFIDIRWEIPRPPIKIKGKTVGGDQGVTDVLVLSDKQKTPDRNKDGYSLGLIMTILSRKLKGSKAFEKAQDHRTNFINWSINQLNFDDINQLKLERIWNIGYKNVSCRYLSHWTNTKIRDKIESRCELLGVQVVHQDSSYRSQRCSCCGLVRKKNRNGKEYSCVYCGNIIDADYNASLNHEVELPEVSWEMRSLKLNHEGFFWKPEGFFALNGEEFTVSLSDNKVVMCYKSI